MTEPHHDPELCRRLVVNVMGWRESKSIPHLFWKGGLVRGPWDPCCDPADSWMLVDKLVNDHPQIKIDIFWEDGAWRCEIEMNQNIYTESGIKLHTTALTIDAAFADKIEVQNGS